MKTVIGKTLKLLFIFTLALSFASCKSSEDGGGTLPSGGGGGGGGDTSPVEDVPVGEIEQTGFWVNIVTDDQFDVYVKKRGQWDEDCFISKDSTTNQHIECLVDLLEQDFFMNNINMQYNAPPGLCAHVRIRPAWSWNFSSGVGPAVVTMDRNVATSPATINSCVASASPALETFIDGAVGDGLVNCNQHPELRFNAEGSDVECIYDYSGDNNGPNCCFGSVLRTYNDDDGTAVTTSVLDGDWPGSIKECSATTLQTTWEYFNPDFPEYPLNSIQRVPRDPSSNNPTGLNDVVELLSNLDNQNVRISVWSNWFEGVGGANAHTHNGFFSVTNSNSPYSVNPIDDLSGDLYVQGNSAANPLRVGREEWRFECLDSAGEIKQRIDVYFREWNTLLDFIAYGNSESLTYNPDVVGDEGVDCDYDPIFSYDGCNDFGDFDDILNDVGGTYGTTPGVHDNDIRQTYFNRVSK